MQSLASLFVSLVVVALVGAGEARAHRAPPTSLDRHATITRAADGPNAAAPSSPDLLSPCVPAPAAQAPLLFASFGARAPLPAPRAALPLYLRHRALLL